MLTVLPLNFLLLVFTTLRLILLTVFYFGCKKYQVLPESAFFHKKYFRTASELFFGNGGSSDWSRLFIDKKAGIITVFTG